MTFRSRIRAFSLFALLLLTFSHAQAETADLAAAPAEALLKVYQQLRSLHAGNTTAVTENVIFKRDAATFTLIDGRLTFAEPVEGQIVAAAFTGKGTITVDPPTEIDKHQLARFAKSDKLEDGFREAVFFFTDDSMAELRKLVNIRTATDATQNTGSIAKAETRLQKGFNDWWDNLAQGRFPVLNIAARMLADFSDPSSRGFFLADIDSEHHDELFYNVSWNRDAILNTFFGTDEEVMLMHYKGGQYSEWWSGFHLAGEYANNPHPEHRSLLAHCSEEHIDAVISKDNHLTASALMQFEVPAAQARVLRLNLEGVLRISEVTDEAGGKISFIQEDRNMDSDPWIILPQTAVAGKQYKLKITYAEDSTRESRVILQEGSGLYYVGARTSWYPSFGAFDDRTHFFLHFTSPKNYKLVATGRKVGSETDGKELDTTWESEIPFSVVGFNYGDFVQKDASGSDLTVSVYAGKQIPDELKGLSAAIDLNDIAGGVNGRRNTAADYGILQGGFNTTSMAGTAAQMSYQAFRIFEYYFGPLPFKTISVSEQPVMGFAQSWPTLIFLSYDSLLDSTTRHSLRLDTRAENREFYNIVAVHEMSHQWWGHMVGWKTYHDQWLSEGFADFSAGLYIKMTDPKRFRNFWDLKRMHLLEKNRAGHRPVDVGPLWLNFQTDGYMDRGTSFFLRYEKGAYVLEMLRMIMEDPKAKVPDGAFISMMRDFVTTYAGKSASTEDFKRIADKYLRENTDWFFNEWVYGTEVPHYDFDYNLKDGENGKTILHFDLAQSEVSDSFYMRVPLYASVKGDTSRLGFISIKGSTTYSKDVALPVHPDKVWIDDTHSLLCTEKQ